MNPLLKNILTSSLAIAMGVAIVAGAVALVACLCWLVGITP